MHVRFLTIAAAAMALTTSAAAEPPKAPVAPANPAPSRPSPVVFASADQVVAPAPAANQASPAPKRRAMRVTTCRCGDPQTQSQEQQ